MAFVQSGFQAWPDLDCADVKLVIGERAFPSDMLAVASRAVIVATKRGTAARAQPTKIARCSRDVGARPTMNRISTAEKSVQAEAPPELAGIGTKLTPMQSTIAAAGAGGSDHYGLDCAHRAGVAHVGGSGGTGAAVGSTAAAREAARAGPGAGRAEPS